MTGTGTRKRRVIIAVTLVVILLTIAVFPSLMAHA